MNLRSTLLKSLTAALAAACIAGHGAALRAAAFTPGNIVVCRVGDPTAGGLVNTGSAIFVDEFTPSGTRVQSITVPSTGTDAVVASGTATSEGLISRSANGQYLVITGYNRAVGGSGSLAGTTGATVNRAVVLVNGGGTITSTTKLTDFADGNNPRSAASVDGTSFWVAGGAGGVRHVASQTATTSTQLSTTVTNVRQLLVTGGQLYTSSGSGAFRVCSVGTGLPTTSGQTITNLAGIPTTGSPYSYFFADLDSSVAGVDTLYVADDTNTAGVGGVRKYSLVSGTWTANGVVGAQADAYRGLTGSVSGGTVTLFSTRKGGSAAAGGGELVSIVDSTGYNATITAAPTLVATAESNTAFRGVEMAPEMPKLIVTEINSNVSGGDFWELTNVGSSSVDLGGWKWDDDSQSMTDAATTTIPAGTTIAAGESIVFPADGITATSFRSVWGALPGVQIIEGATSPGLGQNDGIALFDAAGTKQFFFTYGVGGFTCSDGSASAGGHAGASAGGNAAQSAVIDPAYGFGLSRRYAVATAGTFGAYANTGGGLNVGSPGYSGLSELIVTEINSNVAGGDFWELTNIGSLAVHVGGWKWDDDSQNPNDAAAATIPAGTTIGAGESIVLVADTTSDTAFRTTWSLPASVKTIAGGPGLGGGDGVALFNASGTKLFFFSYGAGGFLRSNGSASTGGHAGLSAGGTATQSAVIDPGFGSGAGKRYAAATVGTFGAYANSSGGANVGSPGTTGLTAGGETITLSLNITPSTFSEAATNPAASGTVSRATSGTTDLVVSLSSSDTTEATVPASVTILANQTLATFDVTAVNDTAPDGSQSVTITATATGANAPTANVTVQDDGDVAETAFLLTEVQSNQSAGKPTGADDYWELTNIGSTTKDISGYTWHDSGRSAAAGAAYKLPSGTTIAAGESVIFTNMAPAAFRAWWGLSNAVQVFQGAGPGLGQNDGVSFFDAGGNEIFFFSYAAAGFTKADGSASTGGHAGPSAGGSADSQSVVWVPSSGTAAPRYTFATGSTLGTVSAVSPATDLGSPGNQGVTVPTVSIADTSVTEGNSGTATLAFTVTRSDTTTAFTVSYAVTGGSATSGTDYAALSSGTLTFTAGGAATQTINVTVNGDTTSESDETVVITLSNVVNTTGATVIGTAAATGTIVNDDVVAPTITTHPVGTTIASGGSTTLSVAASGLPAPTYQWYVGSSGDMSTPVGGATSSSFTTPVLTATTSYWARATNTGGSANSNSATVTVSSGVVSVNLASYVRVGRYNLPEYRRTALPSGTASSNLLCDEASGVAYNWDTDTLFICGDGGKSITQVTKTGQLVDTMSLALNAGNPQGTEFYDPEGITYIGSGQFVFTEERERRLVKFTYAAGTTLTRAAAQTVDLGTFDDNTGTEGLSYDPQTNNGLIPGFIVLKEKSPIGVFQTNIDFAAGTATNGSASATNSTNLFDTTLLGMTDVADVFAFSNLPSMAGQPQAGNMLVLGQENARIVNVDRSGNILSTLNITSDAGNPLSAADQQHEGITMDRAGNIYVVNENGGGSIEYPQLWVYATTTLSNQAPTAVAVNNGVTSLEENTSTASPVKVGDIVVTDDGLGTNVLSLTGADAASFEITGAALYLKAGVVLDYETKTSYAVTISVDDTTVGSTPDATVDFTLTVTDQVVETPAAAAVIITEVAPWSSGNSPVAADWFELTNISANPVTVTGWKVDDDSAAFASSVPMSGITTIAPGESVIFIESNAGNQATIVDTFKANWFGSNVPAGLQIGTYTGSSIGLSSGGDQVNVYNAGGVQQAKVVFGASDATQPYSTFDNTVALNGTSISTLSAVGVNGAFLAANSAVEIGSPGYSAPGVLRITEVAAWGSGNSPAAADWFEVTNVGARAVDMTGWKMDDSSESFAASLPLTGITSIAPGESVIYMETATLAATRATFLSTWFGASPPAGLQVGGYTGSGAGLSTGGDAVNLFDSNNVRRVNLAFGLSPSSAPFASFDNAAGINVGTVSQLSAVGVNGAFAAVNDSTEVGSPGTSTASAPVTFAAWLAQNGYSGTVGGDSDNDGLPDALEYFFNTSPNGNGSRDNLPAMVRNGSDLEFRFSLLSTGMFAGYLECSKDLVTWVNATSGIDYEVITETTNGTQTAVRYRIFSDPTPTAQGPFTYQTPFTASVDRGAISHLTITNHGMVGAGRITGEQLDSFGETMGASSGLFITGWGYNTSTGEFSGALNVLPDRGYNAGDIFSNYAARVHSLPFTFTPYYGTGIVGQTQLSISYGSTTKFTYLDGATMKYTTGLNPTGNSTMFGQTVGTVTTANGPGGSQQSLLSFDAEALHLFADGSGFVSDEYGTYIARFNSSKQITGITQLPAAARPYRPAGTPNFDSVNPPTTGRRNNQGLEGMSVSPDNTRLFALMQSALVQDTGTGTQGRYNTRLFVYDIAGVNLENPVLIGEYAVQLPRYTLNGGGAAANNMAAQSEVIALSNTQLLTLPRDGNGLGKGDTNPPVIKTVDLVDFAAATNILGLYDTEGAQISPGAVLNAGIVPATSTVVVNLLSSADLAKFGFNLNTTSPTASTVSEKIEGMALVPDLSTPNTSDFFLFVGNDNDFRCSDVRMLDTNGNVVSYGDQRDRGITNDATFTVWRISIHPDNRKFFRIGVDTTP